jgi:hypothetical protein
MNRVSNKDFRMKSYEYSTIRSFSDVFRPASCMQSGHFKQIQELVYALFCIFLLLTLSMRSPAGNEMRSGNAC